jgi:predicted signal transduction protein with EAL and GGDEF domain
MPEQVCRLKRRIQGQQYFDSSGPALLLSGLSETYSHRRNKVDRSFVDGLLVDENDTAIVRTILAMARSLGMRAVGEGVETFSQYRFLLEQQCDEMQGYLFAKPLPPQTVTTLLAASGQQIELDAVKKNQWHDGRL